MIPLKINEIITAINGQTITSFSSNLVVKNISTDTRILKKGDLFFAIKGANFDGHNFLNDAVKRRASGLVIAPAHNLPRVVRGKCRLCAGKNIPIIQVTDTIRALGDLARYYRSKISAKVIAITGSNGKTTTKEMIYHMLAKAVSKKAAFCSPKSFNNAIGVPLALLAVEPRHRYVVFELGTNQPGDIPYLAEMVKPDMGVITNIAPTHLEGLKSLTGVARDKLALFKMLSPEGIAVYQPNNKWLKRVIKSAEYKSVTFGEDNQANIQGKHLEIKPNGIEFLVNQPRRNVGTRRIRCFIPILGSWNMSNVLASLAVMQALGFSVARSAQYLRDFKLPPMRMEKETIGGITFINDAYNANPESIDQLLSDLRQIKPAGRKILVLGDMRELGKLSPRFHRAIAAKIAQAGVQILFAVGQAVVDTAEVLVRKHPGIFIFYFISRTEAGNTLGANLKKGDLVVLKGSRAVELEKVLHRVKLTLVD